MIVALLDEVVGHILYTQGIFHGKTTKLKVHILLAQNPKTRVDGPIKFEEVEYNPQNSCAMILLISKVSHFVILLVPLTSLSIQAIPD